MIYGSLRSSFSTFSSVTLECSMGVFAAVVNSSNLFKALSRAFSLLAMCISICDLGGSCTSGVETLGWG